MEYHEYISSFLDGYGDYLKRKGLLVTDKLEVLFDKLNNECEIIKDDLVGIFGDYDRIMKALKRCFPTN